MITALDPVDVPVGWSESPRTSTWSRPCCSSPGSRSCCSSAITLAVYVPSLVRGEPIAPGAPAVENQWLGGPRATAGELTGAGTGAEAADDSGGASGRW